MDRDSIQYFHFVISIKLSARGDIVTLPISNVVLLLALFVSGLHL